MFVFHSKAQCFYEKLKVLSSETCSDHCSCTWSTPLLTWATDNWSTTVAFWKVCIWNRINTDVSFYRIDELAQYQQVIFEISSSRENEKDRQWSGECYIRNTSGVYARSVALITNTLHALRFYLRSILVRLLSPSTQTVFVRSIRKNKKLKPVQYPLGPDYDYSGNIQCDWVLFFGNHLLVLKCEFETFSITGHN